MGALRKLRAKFPKTYAGFPVENPKERSVRERAIAMIIAITTVSIMMLFTADLIVSSQVDLELAVKQRDSAKAEYMAKSALNAGLILISADFAYDLLQAQMNPKGAQLTDSLADFWTVLNGMPPIGGESADLLAGFQESFDMESKVMNADVLDQLRLFDGSFGVNVDDEGRKVNVNYCAVGRCSETLLMLEALFSCPAEKTFLERKNLEPKELAYLIKDWVDENKQAESESGANDEDDPYADRRPKVRAKNAPFDTLDELRMIPGWDNEIHQVFAPFLTVYPFQKNSSDKYKVNINTASRELLVCLFPEARDECQEKSTLAIATRNRDKVNVSEGKKVNDTLKELVCYSGDSASGEAGDRQRWFGSQSTVFSIEAKGHAGDQEKTLKAVVERVMPEPEKDQKSAYQFLYWKMI